LPKARLWKRAAIAMCEELLDALKAAFFDPTLGPPDTYAMRDTTSRLDHLQRIDGAELVEEYCWWAENHPQLITGMVLSAQTKELAETRALQVYIGTNLAEASAA
jgi:hypothetical protein